MAEFERKKRNPAVEKKISEITREDIRVTTVGTLIETDPEINAIVIDDGEKSIKVMLPPDVFAKVEPGKVVRVIGLVAPAMAGEEIELRGEIVQDFSKVDKELYKEYLKLKSSN